MGNQTSGGGEHLPIYKLGLTLRSKPNPFELSRGPLPPALLMPRIELSFQLSYWVSLCSTHPLPFTLVPTPWAKRHTEFNCSQTLEGSPTQLPTSSWVLGSPQLPNPLPAFSFLQGVVPRVSGCLGFPQLQTKTLSGAPSTPTSPGQSGESTPAKNPDANDKKTKPTNDDDDDRKNKTWKKEENNNDDDDGSDENRADAAPSFEASGGALVVGS